MKNKILSKVLAPVLVLTCFIPFGNNKPIFNFEASAETSGDFEYEILDNQAKITDYIGTNTDVEIPSEINGYPVTIIGRSAFADSNLTSINIPNSVTSIGTEAFFSNSLTSISIPNSVTNIGAGAFAINKLTSVTIPVSVTGIGFGAFISNPIITNQAKGIIYVDNWAVDYTGDSTSVSIMDGTLGIADSVFAGNSISSITAPLTSVTIPDSMKNIGEYAFANNDLSSVDIPSSVEKIGELAFGYNYIAPSYEKAENFTISGVKNSVAHTYAAENDFKFFDIKELGSTQAPDDSSTISATTDDKDNDDAFPIVPIVAVGCVIAIVVIGAFFLLKRKK